MRECNVCINMTITIDGAHSEGGGQIVRTAVALSAVTKKPIKIINIRAKRCVPGLSHQHIASINAIAQLFNAKTKGVVLGSKEIEFTPDAQIKAPITINIPTAGSVSLVLQALLIAGIHTKRTIHATINGGATFGKWAPPITYTQEVLGHILKEVGYDFKLDIFKHGFYPKGGAKVLVWIKPQNRIKPFNIKKRGEMKFFGYSVASTDLKCARAAERQKEAALKRILSDAKIRVKYVKTTCPGSAIVLWAVGKNCAIGADALGEPKVFAENVGTMSGDTFEKSLMSLAPIDKNLVDQLIPYLAFAGGSIKVESITDHTLANIYVTEKITGKKFIVDKKQNTISVTF